MARTNLACALALLLGFSAALNFNIQDVTLSSNVAAQGNGYRYMSDNVAMGPSPIFTHTLDDGSVHVAWSNGSYVILNGYSSTYAPLYEWAVPGREARGFVKHGTGEAAVLLWRYTAGNCTSCTVGNCAATCAAMYLAKFTNAGVLQYIDMVDDRIFDFQSGTSRLEFAGTNYIGYYKVTTVNVQCDSTQPGHSTETLRYWPASTGPGTFSPTTAVASPGFCTGAEHSVDARLVYNPAIDDVMPISITDASPAPPGLTLKSTIHAYNISGDGAFHTAGALGGIVPYGADEYVVVFTAPRSTTGFANGIDVAFGRITDGGTWTSGPTFITNLAAGTYATHAHVNDFGCSGNYLVTWAVGASATGAPTDYMAATVDDDGTIVEAATSIKTFAVFSDRDDHSSSSDGSVSYAYVWSGTPTSSYPYSAATENTLHLVKLTSADCSTSTSTSTTTSTSSTTSTTTTTSTSTTTTTSTSTTTTTSTSTTTPPDAVFSGAPAKGSGFNDLIKNPAVLGGGIGGIVLIVIFIIVIAVVCARRKKGSGGGGSSNSYNNSGGNQWGANNNTSNNNYNNFNSDSSAKPGINYDDMEDKSFRDSVLMTPAAPAARPGPPPRANPPAPAYNSPPPRANPPAPAYNPGPPPRANPAPAPYNPPPAAVYNPPPARAPAPAPAPVARAPPPRQNSFDNNRNNNTAVPRSAREGRPQDGGVRHTTAPWNRY